MLDNFTGLPEGAVITVPFGGADYRFLISYRGNDGNDVVLTSIPEPATLVLLCLGVLCLAGRRRVRGS